MPSPSHSHTKPSPHHLYNLSDLLSTISSALLKGLKRILAELILFFALLFDTAFFLLRLVGILLLPLDAVNVVELAIPCNPAVKEEEQEGEEDDPQIDYSSPAMAKGATTDEKEAEENEKEGGAIVEKGEDSIKEASPEPRSEPATVTTAGDGDASPSPARPLMVGLHPAILHAEVVALSSDQNEMMDAEGRDVIDRPEPKPEPEVVRTDLDDGLNSRPAKSLVVGKQPTILNEEIATSSSTSGEKASQDVPSSHRATAAIVQLTRPGAPRSPFPTASAATDPSNHPTTTNRTSSQPTSREQNRSRDLSEDLRMMNAIMKKQLEESNARLNKA